MMSTPPKQPHLHRAPSNAAYASLPTLSEFYRFFQRAGGSIPPVTDEQLVAILANEISTSNFKA